MKMQNEDLLKLKVNILTDNDEEYQDIALLVDKPEFLIELQRARKALNIKKPLSLNGKYWWGMYLNWCKASPDKRDNLNKIAENISRKYKRPSYKDIVIQAVLFGQATDLYAPSVQVVGKHTRFTSERIGIFPTERTTDKEIRDALKLVNKYYQGELTFSKFEYPKKHLVRSKPHPFIRRQRFFYWEKLTNKKTEQIANEWQDKHPNDKPMPDAKSINKDYSSYKKLLKL